MAQITEELKAKAEFYDGDLICREKTKLLLKEVGLPRSLLPCRDIIEGGYVEETGFVWLKQKKKIEHRFEKTGKTVSYAPEITGYVEKLKIKRISGVKAKELLMWVPVNEVVVDDPKSAKVTFKTHGGLFRTYPFSAFDDDDDDDDDQKKDEVNKVEEKEKKAVPADEVKKEEEKEKKAVPVF